jgi:hypothetical protein
MLMPARNVVILSAAGTPLGKYVMEQLGNLVVGD